VFEILSEKLGAYARDRSPGERFGDFVARTIDAAQTA
jgi:hypothetical protein